MSKNNKSKKEAHFRERLLSEMLRLTTSGFGLAAALAWNDVIKEGMKTYIKPLIGESSEVVSMFFYAILVTTLAVLVTYNLTRLKKKD